MRKLALVLGAIVLTSSVLAKEVVAQPVSVEEVVVEEVTPVAAPVESLNKFAIGAGVRGSNKLYKQDDENVMFYPNLDVRYGRFYVKGIQVGAYLYENDMMALSVFVDPMGGFPVDGGDMEDGYDNIDDRDSMVMGGAKLELKDLPAGLQSNVSYKGGEDGQQGDLNILRPFAVTEKLKVTPSVNASMFSSDFVDYYFGVSEKEVNRDANDNLDKEYDGDTAYSYGAKLACEYMFTENVSATAAVGVTQFSSEIEDSPIVDDATNVYGLLEAKYIF